MKMQSFAAFLLHIAAVECNGVIDWIRECPLDSLERQGTIPDHLPLN